MKESILDLWYEYKLPIIDGLVKNNGDYYKYDGNKMIYSNQKLNKKMYENYSDIKVQVSKITSNKKGVNYKIFAGCGSYGSDGWILVITLSEEFCWLILGDINSIEKLEIKSNYIYARNNNDVVFEIPIKNPENMKKVV